jgi:hypothetical protein
MIDRGREIFQGAEPNARLHDLTRPDPVPMYAFPVQPALRCNDKDANATLYASMMCSVFHDPLERKVYQRRATERHRHVNRHLSAEFYKGKERKKENARWGITGAKPQAESRRKRKIYSRVGKKVIIKLPNKRVWHAN